MSDATGSSTEREAIQQLVVVGASAGGLEAVSTLLARFPAPIVVAQHLFPTWASHLAEILGGRTAPPIRTVTGPEPLRAGVVYVVPSGRDVEVTDHTVDLFSESTVGPTPSVDHLLLTASRVFTENPIAVVLTGSGSDGAVGAQAVKALGGTVVVQDPEDAAVDSMPRSALRRIDADHVLPADEIGAALVSLVRQPVGQEGACPVVDIEEHMSRAIEQDFVEQAGDRRADELTVYTCPDCGGVMWPAEEPPPLKFRCHVGHAYAPEMLLGLKSEELESALWACVRLLREKSTLSRQMAARSSNGGSGTLTERIEEQAQLDERHAEVIQELLEAMPNPGDQAAVVVDAFERQAGD